MQEDIGRMIKQARRLKGMTQTEVAEKMGITYQQVQKYEKGKSELTIRRLKQIASVLDVPLSAFLPEGASAAKGLSDEEVELLTAFRGLKSGKSKSMAIKLLRAIA